MRKLRTVITLSFEMVRIIWIIVIRSICAVRMDISNILERTTAAVMPARRGSTILTISVRDFCMSTASFTDIIRRTPVVEVSKG